MDTEALGGVRKGTFLVGCCDYYRMSRRREAATFSNSFKLNLLLSSLSALHFHEHCPSLSQLKRILVEPAGVNAGVVWRDSTRGLEMGLE